MLTHLHDGAKAWEARERVGQGVKLGERAVGWFDLYAIPEPDSMSDARVREFYNQGLAALDNLSPESAIDWFTRVSLQSGGLRIPSALDADQRLDVTRR